MRRYRLCLQLDNEASPLRLRVHLSLHLVFFYLFILTFCSFK